MNKTTIVVSRFNENLDWLNEVAHTMNVIVYNKGEPLELDSNNRVNIINLPNTGRDCHTIFFHIFENYDDLSDFTIFLQGNPLDHFKNTIDYLKNISYETHFEYLCDWLPVTCLADCPYHTGLPMRDTYNRVFQCNETENKAFQFGAGAQCKVSKNRILKRSREFYKNVVDILDYDIKPVEGWVIERFIGEIFMQSMNNTIEFTFIPIIIVCHNNHKYVENTIHQIYKTNPILVNHIIIMNNSSDQKETIEYLNKISPYTKVLAFENKGPWLTPENHSEFYHTLPDKFILTDPDLEFNPNLPSNFVDILSDLSDKYQTSKIGFAIKIDDIDKMYPGDYIQNVCNWESKFWQDRVINDDYVLYKADIDTTFSLINKKYWIHSSLRIAGNFTCRHLPFYLDNGIMSIEEEYEYYTRSKFSSLSKVFFPYFEANYKIENDTITRL
jgi:hypothetical protein